MKDLEIPVNIDLDNPGEVHQLRKKIRAETLEIVLDGIPVTNPDYKQLKKNACKLAKKNSRTVIKAVRMIRMEPLTKMWRAEFLHDYGDQLITSWLNKDLCVAYFILDVIGLKHANKFGLEVGDRCIKEVAEIIRDEFKKVCGKKFRFRPYRRGGDEYAVIVQGLTKEECERIIQRINHRVKKVKLFGIIKLRGMHCGSAVCGPNPDERLSLKELNSKAEAQLLKSKKQKKLAKLLHGMIPVQLMLKK